MSFNLHSNSLSNLALISDKPISRSQPKSRLHSFLKRLHALSLVLLGLVLAFFCVQPGRIYAHQGDIGKSAFAADQGGIKGYVVGSSDVAAYACPDVNVAKCPIKLTLKPGTQVLIVDNVIGSNVPGLNDNAWRKIEYQGQILFVPMRYITITAPNNSTGRNVQDVSFVQTSNEDDSTTASTNPSGFSAAPASIAAPIVFCRTCRLSCLNPGEVIVGFRLINNVIAVVCCPQLDRYDPTAPMTSACIAPPVASFYQTTDGRIDGNAGDRIAVYCRRTGRIEVWSINNSQGHFLVEFNHDAVNAVGRAGLRVSVGDQGVVTIGGDGHGQYWVSLFGGPYNATGGRDFAKIFHCYVG